MKQGTKQTIAITIVSCLVAGALVAAEGEQKRGDGNGKKFPGAGELKAYKAKMHKQGEDYFKERHEANEKFRESLKEKEPAEALTLIITNRKTQYAETKTFMTGLYNDFVTYAKEVFTKHEVPADKLEQFLKNCQERHDEMQVKHAEQNEQLITALEALQGAEDLSWETIKNTIRENAPDRKGNRGKGAGRHNAKGKGEGNTKD